jgi:hypothetical protein
VILDQLDAIETERAIARVRRLEALADEAPGPNPLTATLLGVRFVQR